jgi:hypothetical protein
MVCPAPFGDALPCEWVVTVGGRFSPVGAATYSGATGMGWGDWLVSYPVRSLRAILVTSPRL